MPTPRQIELDAEFARAAEQADWVADPDVICAMVAKRMNATEAEVREAVRTVTETPQ